jgi:hypothetical protein
MDWMGTLRERDVPVGPAARTGLTFTLVTEAEQYPVYASNVEKQLAAFVGRSVIVRGKLVDLRNEGYGEELWIASIQDVKAAPK